MTSPVTNVAVLGSTGSIGRNTLEVIAAAGGAMRVVALSAHTSFDLLVEQARTFRPRWLVACDGQAAAQYDWSALPEGVELLVGAGQQETVARSPEVDVVVAAVVGSAGLAGTWAAVEAGKTRGAGEQGNDGGGGPPGHPVGEPHGGHDRTGR